MINIKNYGITETINNKKKLSLEWDGEYDGNIGQINIKSNNNGKKKNINMEFDNADLLNLLNHTEVNESIDQRLINDFLTSKKKSKKKSRTMKTKKTKKTKKSKI